MRLYRFELKKLFGLRMVWCFLVLSLLLNGFLTLTNLEARPWLAYIAEWLPVTFQRTDDPAFAAGLDTLPPGEFRDRLAEQAAVPQNTLAGYDTAALGEREIGMLGITGKWAERVREKYKKLQPIVDGIAASGAPYDLYAGEATHDFQVHLTGIVLHAALTEALLLAVLLTLYALGYEEQNRTSFLVYATRTGRGVCRAKLTAAVTASLLCCLLLYALTLLPYALLYRLRDFLRMNVSSSFNYLQSFLSVKPFLTWRSFSLAGYLGATLALGAVLTVVFALCAAVCGLLLRNTYAAFLVWFAASACSMALPVLCGGEGLWGGYFLGLLLPVPVWGMQQYWFTELGGSAFLPWQETVAVGLGLLVFGALTFLAACHFHRKDLT